MRRILLLFRKEFFKELDAKPSWGRRDIKELFIIVFNNVLIGNVKDDTDQD